jgi:hypothetical protein
MPHGSDRSDAAASNYLSASVMYLGAARAISPRAWLGPGQYAAPDSNRELTD